jgi:tetratricopeptide (TPR) repeat protein
MVAAAVVAMAPATAHAQQARAYIEKFVGWSKDGTFYAITEAGTDERELPALCVSRRGDKPPTWPKDIPPPDKDDERGCTETLDQIFEGQDAQALVAKVSRFVVAPSTGRKGPHGETVVLHTVGDRSIVEVTVAQGKKSLGRGYFFLRDKSAPVPDKVTAYWRDDGFAIAVEAGFEPAADPGPGFGPPAYLVVIPLDGSTANAARPKTTREQSSALNLEGMKLLKAGKLDEAQRQFAAATEADPSFSLAHYNLASVASLRRDTNPAVSAMQKVIGLASSDSEAKQALAKAKTDHDLDFIASQSPYVAKLLGRPRTKGDDWCIAAEKRARDMNPGNFIGIAEEAASVLDPSATHGGIPAGKDPVFSCYVRDGASQFSITMYVHLSAKNKPDRIMRIAWEIFPDGMFDADAFPDEKQSKTIRLQKLERVARISRTIAGAKTP